MSDDLSKVDWGKPIEAFHEDGRVVEAQFGSHESGGTASVKFMGRYENALKPSGYVGNGWRIRNVAEPVQAPSDDIAKRMEALVRRMAETFAHLEGPLSREARAIVALLPEPVDSDEEEALALRDRDWWFEDGAALNAQVLAYGVDCIRRGRALERDSREG